MQAAGSEAERRQAGLTERKVRVASLTEAECRVMQSRSHTSLLINPILNHFIVIKCVRVAYHSWGHPLGRYGWNGDGRVGCGLARTFPPPPRALNLYMRTSPAASYSPSGTSVESTLDIPDPNTNITRDQLMADELHVCARRSSVAHGRCPRELRAVASQPFSTSRHVLVMLH